jgi:hypothetical protein
MLEGEAGKGKLSRLQSTINARRRMMVAQIAALYRILPSVPMATSKGMQDGGELNMSFMQLTWIWHVERERYYPHYGSDVGI